jgi:hypothetical protein
MNWLIWQSFNDLWSKQNIKRGSKSNTIRVFHIKLLYTKFEINISFLIRLETMKERDRPTDKQTPIYPLNFVCGGYNNGNCNDNNDFRLRNSLKKSHDLLRNDTINLASIENYCKVSKNIHMHMLNIWVLGFFLFSIYCKNIGYLHFCPFDE